MNCPTCHGEKKFVLTTAFAYMREHGKPAIMPCPDCDATGQVDDRCPEWKPLGQALKDARIARRELLRDCCHRTGVDPVLRSRQERGLADPSGAKEE